MSTLKLLLNALILPILVSLYVSPSPAVEVAPRISNKAIVNKFSKLDEWQKMLKGQADKQHESADKQLDAEEKRSNKLRADTIRHFDHVIWFFAFLMTILLITFAFVIRMQWQMDKSLSKMQTSLAAQKEDLAFLKKSLIDIIEKLLPPPRGAL